MVYTAPASLYRAGDHTTPSDALTRLFDKALENNAWRTSLITHKNAAQHLSTGDLPWVLTLFICMTYVTNDSYGLEQIRKWDKLRFLS